MLCAYVNGENGCGEAGTRTTMLNGNGPDNHNDNGHDNHNDDDKYTCTASGLGAGGVYIGMCTASSSGTKNTSCNLESNGGVTVSFFDGELDTGKPKGGKSQSQDESEANIRIGNAHKRDCGEGENCVQNVLLKSGESHAAAGSSCRNLGFDIFAGNPLGADDVIKHNYGTVDTGNQPVIRKSPCLSSSSHRRKKGWCRKNRRPQSMMEECDIQEDSQFILPSRTRRASSPFKNEIYKARSSERIEMKAMRCRRGSEPLRHPPREASPSGDAEVDMLTIGSRNSYPDSYLETSIEEDCGVFEACPDAFGAPNVAGDSSFVFGIESDPREDPFSPLIKLPGNAVCVDLDKVHSKLDPKPQKDSENEESRQPLLQDSVAESDQAKSGLYTKECNTSVERHLHASGEALANAQGFDSVFFPSCKDDTESGASPNTPGSRCPQGGTQQQGLLTSYARNLTPPCSTSSSNLSPRQSCSDGSRRSTMEKGGYRTPGQETPRRQTMESSRRSTAESRRSTMESGGTSRRPVTGRKKRWQHFRYIRILS